MKFDKDCEVIWKDRKRHFGLPISFYRYYIVKKEGGWVKFFRHKGFLTSVIDVSMFRSLFLFLIEFLKQELLKFQVMMHTHQCSTLDT